MVGTTRTAHVRTMSRRFFATLLASLTACEPETQPTEDEEVEAPACADDGPSYSRAGLDSFRRDDEVWCDSCPLTEQGVVVAHDGSVSVLPHFTADGELVLVGKEHVDLAWMVEASDESFELPEVPSAVVASGTDGEPVVAYVATENGRQVRLRRAGHPDATLACFSEDLVVFILAAEASGHVLVGRRPDSGGFFDGGNVTLAALSPAAADRWTMSELGEVDQGPMSARHGADGWTVAAYRDGRSVLLHEGAAETPLPFSGRQDVEGFLGQRVQLVLGETSGVAATAHDDIGISLLLPDGGVAHVPDTSSGFSQRCDGTNACGGVCVAEDRRVREVAAVAHAGLLYLTFLEDLRVDTFTGIEVPCEDAPEEVCSCDAAQESIASVSLVLDRFELATGSGAPLATVPLPFDVALVAMRVDAHAGKMAIVLSDGGARASFGVLDLDALRGPRE